jgi:cytoskeleton protein RodZ
VGTVKRCGLVTIYFGNGMATFGPLLRRTREQRGVTLDDVARETRLSKRYLVALEEEAIAKLPGGTYNRAYLKTYATFLALQPETLLRDYAVEADRQSAASQQDLLETMNRTIDKRQADGGRSGRQPAAWMVAVAGVVVVAGVIGAAWYGMAGVSRHAPADLETESFAVTAPVTPPPPVVPPPPAAAPVEMPPPAAATPASDASATQPAPDRDARAAHEGPDEAAAAPPASTAPAPPELLSDPAPLAAGSPSSHLSISGSGVGTAVVDRQLVGQAGRFTVGSRVVFWTHVVGGKAGDTIDHVWLRDGSVVGAASLNVGSADWRTQSRRVLDPAGRWVVEARDADGRVLARHEFETSAQ